MSEKIEEYNNKQELTLYMHKDSKEFKSYDAWLLDFVKSYFEKKNNDELVIDFEHYLQFCLDEIEEIVIN